MIRIGNRIQHVTDL